jgi:hypothetical protein
MKTEPETFPACGRYTETGRQQLAVENRSRPIYGTDLSQPLSKVIEKIRSDIVKARGQLGDVSAGYTGWAEHLAPIEGLLTCGLSALFNVREQMRGHEKAHTPTTVNAAWPAPDKDTRR